MKRIHSLLIAVLLLIAVPLVSGGCKGGPRVDQISKVLNEPNSFIDKDATVAGKVVRVFEPAPGLIRYAMYQVDDGSGKIWVLSRAGAPSRGTEVGLKGRVREDLDLLKAVIPGDLRILGDLIPMFLEEKERRTR